MATPRTREAVNASRLARDLRTVANNGDLGFAALVRKVGLDPRRDFRRACLDGTDLRGQDLRGFDFRNASFRDAKIHGAIFDPPLSGAQIKSAIRRGRAITLFVGHNLESAVKEFDEALAPSSMVAPNLLNDALKRVGREREQHYTAGGVFLSSDAQRLVNRLMAGAMRKEQAAVRDSAATVIFFEPTTDFDFDTLSVLHSRIERAGGRHLTFVFPAEMPGESGRKLFDVRAKTFRRPQDVIIFERGSDKPAALRAAQQANARALQHVVEWLQILDSARLVAGLSADTESESFSKLITGLVQPRASLVSALRAAMADPASSFREWSSLPRRLFLPSSLVANADMAATASVLSDGGMHSSSIAVFNSERPPGVAQRFFVLEASRTSSAWNLAT